MAKEVNKFIYSSFKKIDPDKAQIDEDLTYNDEEKSIKNFIAGLDSIKKDLKEDYDNNKAVTVYLHELDHDRKPFYYKTVEVTKDGDGYDVKDIETVDLPEDFTPYGSDSNDDNEKDKSEENDQTSDEEVKEDDKDGESDSEGKEKGSKEKEETKKENDDDSSNDVREVEESTLISIVDDFFESGFLNELTYTTLRSYLESDMNTSSMKNNIQQNTTKMINNAQSKEIDKKADNAVKEFQKDLNQKSTSNTSNDANLAKQDAMQESEEYDGYEEILEEDTLYNAETALSAANILVESGLYNYITKDNLMTSYEYVRESSETLLNEYTDSNPDLPIDSVLLVESYIVEKTLKAKDRNKLNEDEFGIPSLRKYPMPDKAHVSAAIQRFNHVDKKHEKELASNIIKKLKQFDMLNEVEVSDKNRFKPYLVKAFRDFKESFDVNPFPAELTNEFSVGAMLPMMGSTDGWGTKLANTPIEDVVAKGNSDIEKYATLYDTDDMYNDAVAERKKIYSGTSFDESLIDSLVTFESALPKRNKEFDDEVTKVVRNIKPYIDNPKNTFMDDILKKAINFRKNTYNFHLRSQNGSDSNDIIKKIQSCGFKEVSDEGIKGTYEKTCNGIVITINYDAVGDKMKITYDDKKKVKTKTSYKKESSDEVVTEMVDPVTALAFGVIAGCIAIPIALLAKYKHMAKQIDQYASELYPDYIPMSKMKFTSQGGFLNVANKKFIPTQKAPVDMKTRSLKSLSSALYSCNEYIGKYNGKEILRWYININNITNDTYTIMITRKDILYEIDPKYKKYEDIYKVLILTMMDSQITTNSNSVFTLKYVHDDLKAKYNTMLKNEAIKESTDSDGVYNEAVDPITLGSLVVIAGAVGFLAHENKKYKQKLEEIDQMASKLHKDYIPFKDLTITKQKGYIDGYNKKFYPKEGSKEVPYDKKNFVIDKLSNGILYTAKHKNKVIFRWFLDKKTDVTPGIAVGSGGRVGTSVNISTSTTMYVDLCSDIGKKYGDYYVGHAAFDSKVKDTDTMNLINRVHEKLKSKDASAGEITKEYVNFMEASGETDIDSDIADVIAKLNKLGYRTKYSCSGHTKARFKSDIYRDGVLNDHLYTTARIVFQDDYKLTAPDGWKLKKFDGLVGIYPEPKRFKYTDGNPYMAFEKWKEEYMKSLRDWVKTLDEKPGPKETVESSYIDNFLDDIKSYMENSYM